MKVLVGKTSLRLILKWIQRVLFAGAIFENESKSAGGSDPWNRRGREAYRDTVGQLREFPVHVLHDLLILRLAAGAILPVIQCDEE